MKKAEFQQRIIDGEFLCIVEYRGSKADVGRIREDDGKMRKWVILKHQVEGAVGAFPVNEDVRDNPLYDPDTFVPTDYKSPFRKGQKVILQMTRLGKDKAYNIEAGGTLHLLEDDEAAKPKAT